MIQHLPSAGTSVDWGRKAAPDRIEGRPALEVAETALEFVKRFA
jgi:hypothetical protein